MAGIFDESTKNFTRASSVKEDMFLFKNADKHTNNLLKSIQQKWKNNDYCDIELIVGIQEKVVKAHKIILVSSCEYFSALLKPVMLEGNQTSIKCLEHLQSVAVLKLIEYCYTGTISVKIPSDMDIEHLLEAADYMRLQAVCQKIGEFLESNLNDDNCVGFLQCADYYNLPTLQKSAFKYASHNFIGITESQEFLTMPTSLLEKVLKSETLVIQKDGFVLPHAIQEDLLTNSVLRFVEYDIDNRLRDLPLLMTSLKLPLLTKEQLMILEENYLIKETESCMKIIAKAKNTKALKVTDTESESWARPRKCHGLLLREFYEHADGGQVRPEVNRFDCRDILEVDKDAYVTGMKIGIVRWNSSDVIGGFQVFYSNKKCPVYGTDPFRCERFGEFHLNVERNERIVKIDLQKGLLIDKLVFTSSLALESNCAYGGEGGNPYREIPPENSCAYLAGVSGTVVKSIPQGSLNVCCISKLKFMWGFYDFSEEQQISKELLLDSSQLCLYSADYNYFDSNTDNTLRKGEILSFLSEKDGDEFPNCLLGQGRMVDLMHCKSNSILTLSSFVLKKCDDYLLDPR